MHRLCLLFLSWLVFYVWPTLADSRNITLEFTDSALAFSAGWKASRAATGDLAFVFDNVGATALVITLPPLVSHITYTGLGRTGGSLFGVCLDCNDDFTDVTVSDAHDPQLTDNALAVPADIFSLPLDPSEDHIITILNIPDNRFNGQSELTFVSISITIDDGVQTTTTTTSSLTSTTLSSTFSPLSTSVLTTATSSSTSETASPSVSAQPSNAAISSNTRNSIIAVISILSFIGLGSLLLGLFFYRRRRARRKSRVPESQFPEKSRLTSQPSLKLPIMSASKATPRYGSGTEALGPLAAAGRSRPTTRLLDPGP
ncbi:hypothetical protein VKT23_005731 [Stygiomarasmius scandens]|uniref:Uncharacterized protein n=1 Tax=Marasmiellus scandens TaxID=2682957 RepID=A0ABR1JSG5_9AGAR